MSRTAHVRRPRPETPKSKGWISGWCNQGSGHHDHCQGGTVKVPCVCACHAPTEDPELPTDPYEALVERVARLHAARVFPMRGWDDLRSSSRQYSRRTARQAVELVTAELTTWEA